MKSAVCLAGALLLSCTGASLAQSPFDGTWKADQSKNKTENAKPFVGSLAQGRWHCESCTPAYTIKADGTDQSVPDRGFDTLSVKEIDAKSVSFVAKKNQRVVWEATDTVSADGKTLTFNAIYHPTESGKPNHWLTTFNRVGIASSVFTQSLGNGWKSVPHPATRPSLPLKPSAMN
ncbi:MAG: hypothetical protein JOZ33_09525 [Acidobacteriaceae bacterium]|nr:hypothetical protein [Acidobacteriaceae bacterium]